MNAPYDPLEQQRPPPTPFRFSVEDQKIIQECNREAFFRRCLPFSAGFGGLTLLAVKAGYFKPHASWGPVPKVMGAVFLGYFVGKISYQTICAEKLMANPKSQLGAMLRARRQQGGGGSFQDTLTLELPGMSMPDDKSVDIYRDDNVRSTFTDLDTDRPYQGLDDAYQPSFDSPQRPEDFILPPQATTPNSYEEMRRKNREEFERKSRAFRSPQEQHPSQQYFPPPQSQYPSGSPTEPVEHYKPTNIYGDIFDK